MKKTFTILILLMYLSINSQTGWLGIDNNDVPVDKQTHFVAGSASGTVFYTLGYNWTKGDRFKAFKISIGITTALGTIKEITDSTGFDTYDLLATMAGGVASAWVTDALMSNHTYEERQFLKEERIKRRDKSRAEHYHKKQERKRKRKSKRNE